MRRVAAPALALALLLAGCGGGSHAAPSLGTASGASNVTNGSGATTTFALTIPNAAKTAATATRKAQYVSPSTLSASVTVNPGGHVTTFNLPTTGAPCTTVTGGRACNLTVVAPVGSDTASLTLYDGPCTGGPPCVVSGNTVGAASSFAFTVAEGASNVTVPLVVGGVPAFVSIAAPGLVGRTDATVPMTVTAYDADQNVIVGPANYVNGSGTATTIDVAVAIATTQAMIHDGGQSGTLVHVASPSDAVTLQLSGAADILGVPFSATIGGSRLYATATTSQSVAVSGSLSGALKQTIGFMPDYFYFSPMDTTMASGLVNGFVMVGGYQGGGGTLYYYNDATESLNGCTFGNNLTAVAPAANGVAAGFATGLFADTAPWGLKYYTLAQIAAGGGCPTPALYETDTLGDDVAAHLVYDQTNGNVYERSDGTGLLRAYTLSGSTISGGTTLASGSSSASLVSLGGAEYAVGGSDTFQRITGTSAPSTSPFVAAAAFGQLAKAYDDNVYAIDHTGDTVYGWNGSGATPALAYSAFTIAPSSNEWGLAIGPDGNAYTTTTGTTLEQLTPSGATQQLTLPTTYTPAYTEALFDGHNGYVYAVLFDGSGGNTYVDRISN